MFGSVETNGQAVPGHKCVDEEIQGHKCIGLMAWIWQIKDMNWGHCGQADGIQEADYCLALMMLMNSGLSEAPPTRNPSTSG